MAQTGRVDLGFAPLREDDLPLLATWIGRPHVEPWWGEPSDLAAVTARYRPLLGHDDPTEGFVVRLDDRSIGFVQRYRIGDDPDWRAAIAAALGEADGFGIDYLIGEPDVVGRGVGRAMIAEFVDRSWSRYPDAGRCVVALQQANTASWRALEGAGFHRVWAGSLESDDPSDEGPSYLYVRTARAA